MSQPAEERANLELSFAPDAGGTTRLSRRYARYPWSLTRPFWIDRAPTGMASLIPQSSSGLLLPGDRFTQEIALESGASAHLTSQGAQVVHGLMGGEPAQSHWNLSLAEQSYLELILDPVVLFPFSGLCQSFAIKLERESVLVLSDGMTWHPDAGKPAFDSFMNLLELRNPAGKTRFKEKSIQGSRQLQTVSGVGGMPCAYGQMWLLFGSDCPEEIAFPVPEEAAVYAASSRLSDRAGILLRFLTYDASAFAAYQRRLWRSLRHSLFGQLPTDRRKGG